MNRAPFTTLHRQPDPAWIDRRVGMAPFAERRAAKRRITAFEMFCIKGSATCLTGLLGILLWVWAQ